jgi:hypothetical protein
MRLTLGVFAFMALAVVVLAAAETLLFGSETAHLMTPLNAGVGVGGALTLRRRWNNAT